MRVVVLLLVAATAAADGDVCDLDAVAKWNRFAITSAAYLDLRKSSVVDVRLRARMRKEFETVMSCECF